MSHAPKTQNSFLVPLGGSCQNFRQAALRHGGAGRGTPYVGLYGEALPERGTFFRRQVYKRVGISQVKVYKRFREIGHSVI